MNTKIFKNNLSSVAAKLLKCNITQTYPKFEVGNPNNVI